MPGVADVLNRKQPPRAAQWLTATVTAVAGRRLTLTINPGGNTTQAVAVDAVPVNGAKVLLVCTPIGNFVLGTIG